MVYSRLMRLDPHTRYDALLSRNRRFDGWFRQRDGLNPLRLRKGAGASASGDMTFPLPYRPPFACPALIRLLAQRRADGVERIDAHGHARVVALHVWRLHGEASR